MRPAPRPACRPAPHAPPAALRGGHRTGFSRSARWCEAGGSGEANERRPVDAKLRGRAPPPLTRAAQRVGQDAERACSAHDGPVRPCKGAQPHAVVLEDEDVRDGGQGGGRQQRQRAGRDALRVGGGRGGRVEAAVAVAVAVGGRWRHCGGAAAANCARAWRRRRSARACSRSRIALGRGGLEGSGRFRPGLRRGRLQAVGSDCAGCGQAVGSRASSPMLHKEQAAAPCSAPQRPSDQGG